MTKGRIYNRKNKQKTDKRDKKGKKKDVFQYRTTW